MTDKQQLTCIHCGKDNSQVPLINFSYQGADYQICTEHLPVLIHNPHNLTGKLPDAENLTAVDTA